MPQKKVNSAVISIIVIILIGAGAGILYAVNNNSDDSDTTKTETTTSETTIETGESGETTVSTYEDGEHTATGSFSTPSGTESVTVTVTLENDIVTAVQADGSATGGNSAQYQEQFLENYESEVVGKDLDEVELDRVAGSSLTSNGFNAAIETIKNGAKT